MKRRTKVFGALLLCLGLLALLSGAVAERSGEARDITALCEIKTMPKQNGEYLTDRNYKKHWVSAGYNPYIEVTAPLGEEIGGIWLKFYDHPGPFRVLAEDAAGEWKTIAVYEGDFRSAYLPLPEEQTHVRIMTAEGLKRFYLSELYVISAGETPEWVHQWQPPLEKADILVMSTHPDDELLFLGGTIAHYAGQLQKKVQVTYLVGTSPFRRLELLDGLWHCGVRNYPDVRNFRDSFSGTRKGMYQRQGWAEDGIDRAVVTWYRRYKPEVVVTQDLNGEYGHGAHKVLAWAARKCVDLAADPKYQHKKLPETEAWQVKKLYLHLYEENQVHMDWKKPLSAFGGKTALEITTEAFAMHISQQNTEYEVVDGGPYDNALFGLVQSTVGEDTPGVNDFWENIDE